MKWDFSYSPWLARLRASWPAGWGLARLSVLSRLAQSRAFVAVSLRDGLTVVRVEPPAVPGGRLRVVHASHHADVVANARALRLAGLLRGASQLLLLPTALRTFHSLPRPQVPDAELSEATRWQLAPNLDFAPEQALVQVLPQPALSDNPALQLLAVLAHGPAVRDHLAPLHEAGWAPEVVDIEETAQRNLMLLAAPGASAGLTAGAAVGFADNEALITLVAGGELCLTRAFAFDAFDSAAAAERLALQLQRALDGFERQTTRFAVKSVLLLPGPLGTALPAALAGQISQRLNPVALTDLFEFSDAAASALEEPALYAHLLGSAAGRLMAQAVSAAEAASAAAAEQDNKNAGPLSESQSLMLPQDLPAELTLIDSGVSAPVSASVSAPVFLPVFAPVPVEGDDDDEDFNTRLQRQAREALLASDAAAELAARRAAQGDVDEPTLSPLERTPDQPGQGAPELSLDRTFERTP